MMLSRLPRPDGYRLLLAGLILFYIWVFAGLSFAQHAGMRTHKADLGQIDQAIWNSSRGRFVEMTDNGFVATRMTDHVEPVLAMISPVYWVWDDVRAILLLQVIAVGIGAWPLYALALRLMDRTLSPAARGRIWELEPLRRLTQPLALTLAVAYLLTPQLQSALLTEFHAVPLAVPLILWALWAVEARRWRQYAAAVLLVMSVKEETALLAAGLGLWGIWRAILARRSADPLQGVWRIGVLGAGLTVVGLAWFYTATFVIVPAHAVEVYGTAESYYFQRYGALGDSPLDIFTGFFTQPGLVWSIATEPARMAYLRGLLMPYGWLAILAPELVLLGLPVLLANLLSAYPAQYYGEFHYSAPVVVYFAAAAAYGLARLWRAGARRLDRDSGEFQHLPAAHPAAMALAALVRNSRTALQPLLAVVLVVWIGGWAVAGYIEAGREPGGGRYDPTTITAHHRLLDRFTAQIPSDAAVTATAAVHPHVSHRRYVYQFPIGLEPPGRANWALLDVTTNTDMAPGDVRTTVEQMLAGEWRVVDAADGFLLLRKGAEAKTIPAAFYDFARAPRPVAPSSPGQSLSDEEAPLLLTDVAAVDWPRWRQTKIVTTWQVGPDFDAASMAPSLTIRAPDGETHYRFADAMPPALAWYPPQEWQPGDVIQVRTLGLYLPRSFGVVIQRTPGLRVAEEMRRLENDTAVLTQVYRRRAPGELARMERAVPVTAPIRARTARFTTPAGGALQLNTRIAPALLRRGRPLDVWLQWEGSAWPVGHVAFLHLRQEGENQAQRDGLPRYFISLAPVPLSGDHNSIIDWRQLTPPPDAVGEDWALVVGLYDSATGERLPVMDAQSPETQTPANEFTLSTITTGPPPVPDQSCALIPATCASQVE